MRGVSDWLTPPQVARERGIKPAKVLAFIASGELEAVNHATSRIGRSRWLISRAALEAFDRSRSSRTSAALATPRRRRERTGDVIEFF
jgi:hypothetical protein